jgi:hypothetical protein
MHLKYIELYFINNPASPFRQPTALPIKTAQSVRPRPAERNSTLFNTGEISRIKYTKRALYIVTFLRAIPQLPMAPLKEAVQKYKHARYACTAY